MEICVCLCYDRAKNSISNSWKAIMLNLRGKNNAGLKKACRTLRDYAIFTDKLRDYAKKMSIEEAADRAIEECIREGVLKEFLEKHRAEARMMSIFEYDQEKHLRMEREEAWQEGRDAKLLEQVQRKLEKGKSAAQIAEELEEDE